MHRYTVTQVLTHSFCTKEPLTPVRLAILGGNLHDSPLDTVGILDTIDLDNYDEQNGIGTHYGTPRVLGVLLDENGAAVHADVRPASVHMDITEHEFRVLMAAWAVVDFDISSRPNGGRGVMTDLLDRLAQRFGYRDALQADQFQPREDPQDTPQETPQEAPNE